MTKTQKIAVGVVALAIAGYFAWRWWMKRKQSQQQANGNQPYLGTNLNSEAASLVAGPSVGPAVSLPMTITLIEQASGHEPEDQDVPHQNGMIGGGWGANINPLIKGRNQVLEPVSTPNAADGAGMDEEMINSATSADAATGFHDNMDRSGTTFDTSGMY